MSAVKRAEVSAGLVVHLDTQVLRDLRGAETNAKVCNGHDRAVQGPHYFLVLEVEADTCIATPLFSKAASGSDLLDEARKAGLADKWIGQPTYTSRWQHWRIPLASIEAASRDEESDPVNRRTYARGDAAELERILSWQAKNRCPYRAV
ncbi:hypothetical protein [Rhodocaloribacter sp.]